jgi:hypothetical protein
VSARQHFLWEDFMPQTVQVGAILVKGSTLTPELLGLEIEHYSENWNLVRPLDGFALDRKIHGVGWNFFFIVGEVRAMFFGAIGAKKIQNALHRIFEKVIEKPYNALEVTAIVQKRFLGLPYTIVSAHSRHIQQSCYLNAQNGRWTSESVTWHRSAVERELRFRSAVV